MEKKFVVPGDFIGTEEEYLAGDGTYVEGERIYSSIAGEVFESARKLSVRQKKSLRQLGVGTVFVGRVENIVEPIALVSMRVGQGEDRFEETDEYAVLHASMIRKGFVKNVRDEYRIGDIIRAKIVDERNGEMRLSTDGENLGAIKAFCKSCRHPLKLEARLLKCENCGQKDSRKIASDYRRADVQY
ncbi:MAG: exosome complex RNA-binding protein Csl4 [Candidatus Micrarchaeota archaeon]|nr:exosome complex RNA-binding protein Csl4 [Candidatus Micrarchaeota archaeon]